MKIKQKKGKKVGNLKKKIKDSGRKKETKEKNTLCSEIPGDKVDKGRENKRGE